MFINTKNKLIWKNGSFEKWDDSNVHVLSHTLHYGTGVFEGVRAYNTSSGPAIFRLNDHTNRLFSAADKISIKIPFSEDQLNKAQCDAFNINKLSEGYIRPMCFYGSEGMGLRADNLKVHCIVAAGEWPSYMSPEACEKGINIKVSSYKRETGNIVARSKVNGNYVTSIMALQ